jgi:hypothetical protein
MPTYAEGIPQITDCAFYVMCLARGNKLWFDQSSYGIWGGGGA